MKAEIDSSMTLRVIAENNEDRRLMELFAAYMINSSIYDGGINYIDGRKLLFDCTNIKEDRNYDITTVNSGELLSLLRKNFNVPDYVTSFTLTGDIDRNVTADWQTYLTSKSEDN